MYCTLLKQVGGNQCSVTLPAGATHLAAHGNLVLIKSFIVVMLQTAKVSPQVVSVSQGAHKTDMNWGCPKPNCSNGLLTLVLKYPLIFYYT